MSFLDEHCISFDSEEENKLEFTAIHKVSPLNDQIFTEFQKTR